MQSFRSHSCLILVAVLSSGCTALADRLATRLTDRALVKVEHEVQIIDGDLALYRSCLSRRGGSCQGTAGTALPQSGAAAPLPTGLSAPVHDSVESLEASHPAQAGRAVLDHPFLHKIAALHDRLRGLDSGGAVAGFDERSSASDGTTLTLTTSPAEVQGFFDQVNAATASGSWQALSEQAAKQAATPGAPDGVRRDARTLAFLRRYTEAYFENGRFVKIELDTQDLDKKVEDELSRNAGLFCGDPAQTKQCDTLVTFLQSQILKGVGTDAANKSFVLLPMATRGYVSRTGQGFAFPGFQVTLDPEGARSASVAPIDLTRVGTDLVWVFFQALFDASEGLPAVSTATGVDLGPEGKDFALPVFNPAVGNVDAKDLQTINTFSNQTGAFVGTAFDKAIRGIGPFSLNNEAVEELLVAVVTATVSNAAQKGAWCWFSCNLDQQIEKAAASERESIRSGLRKDAERIKLRLRLL